MDSNQDIQLKKEDLETLKRDISYITLLADHIDRKYGKGESETYHYLKKLRSIIDRFNDKYPNIHAVVNKTYLKISISFFIKKTSPDEIFSHLPKEVVKERIFGQSVEIAVPGEIDKTYNNEKLDLLALKRCPHRNMVELVYRQDTIYNAHSPEFRILAEHALPDYRKEIKIKADKDDVFCFDFDEDNEDKGLLYSKKPESGEISY